MCRYSTTWVDNDNLLLHSVRAKIRDGLDNYYAFDDYWIRCLYEDEQGDPEDVEKGFLKSSLLVKVCTLPLRLQGANRFPNRHSR